MAITFYRDNAKFFIYGISGIIDLKTYEVLESYDATIVDLYPQLSNPNTAILDQFMDQNTRGSTNYFLPSVPTLRLEHKPYMERAIILSHNNIPGGMSAFGQVCAILGYPLISNKDIYYDVFATDHVRGLRAFGASEEEIKHLTLCDRLIKGGTIQDEASAAALITNTKPLIDDDEFLIYEFDARHVHPRSTAALQRSIIDYILTWCKNSCEISLIFHLKDTISGIESVNAFTTNMINIDTATAYARKSGYATFPNSSSDRHGLYFVEIVGQARKPSIDSLGRFFAHGRGI